MPLSKQIWQLTATTVSTIGLVTGCAQLEISQLEISQIAWLTGLRQFGEWSTLWLCSTAGVWIFFRLPQVDLGWVGSELGSHHRDRTFGQLQTWQTDPVDGDREKATALATFWAIAYPISTLYVPWSQTLTILPLAVKNLLIPAALAVSLAALLWKIANSPAPICQGLKRVWQLFMVLCVVNWLVWLWL